MKTIALAASIAACCLLAAGTAAAHPPKDGASGTHAGHGAHADHEMDKPRGTDASTQTAAQAFAALDTNGDGRVSRADIPAGHPMAAHFAMADEDGDGSLDAKEFAAHHGM